MIRTLVLDDVPEIMRMYDRVRVKLPTWYPQLSEGGCRALYHAKDYYHHFEVSEEEGAITGVLLATEGWPIFKDFTEVLINQFITETETAARDLYASLLQFCRIRGRGRIMFSISSGLPSFLTTKTCPGLQRTGVLLTEDF